MEAYRVGSVDTTVYFDDFTWGHAYVPPAPGATPGNTTANVDVDPGQNVFDGVNHWENNEFAITIGGGGYTLGTDWVQDGGSIGGSQAWQTDANWGTETIAGLVNGTEYALRVVARVSSGMPLSTDITYSGEATVTPAPEPAALALLGLGLPLVLNRRRRLRL